MKSELIKASIRQELSKHYDLEKDYVKFSEAEIFSPQLNLNISTND